MPNKFEISIIIGLILAMVSCANAAQNQILSTSVRKISDNTVNFTFYTQGENLEKPIVKSKGNNEYTILLPNLSNNPSSVLNIKQTDGIVTSADVKTISEGAVTYTKINVKTSKPVTLNAETRRTTQSANDLSNINSIVSKVNLINQDIQNSKGTEDKSQAPTTQASVKISSVKDIIRQNSSSAPKKNAIQEAVAVSKVSSHTPSPKKIESANSKLKDENIKNIKPVSNISKSEKNSKDLKKNEVTSPTVVKEPTVSVSSNNNIEDFSVPDIPDIDIDLQTPVYGSEIPVADKFKDILFSPITTIMLLGLILLAVFAMLFKKMMSNLAEGQAINDSFIEKLNTALTKPKNKDFSEIVNNRNMSWQEKYRAFTASNGQKPYFNAKYDDVISDEKPSSSVSKEDFDSNERIEPLNKEEASKFKGFEAKTAEPSARKTYYKPHKLKSFSQKSSSSKSLREKLDYVVNDRRSAIGHIPSKITNTVKKYEPKAQDMRIVFNSAIDNDRNFYIVKENDKYSLLGRVKNKLIILKHLGVKAPDNLQTRRDKGNSFIVKAGDFKASVSISENDMNIYSLR